MKKLLLISSMAAIVTGCATTSFIGDKDQYAVHRDTGFAFGTMTPAITIVEERSTGKFQTFAGQSAFSQVGGVAGNVASAALISEGLKHAGTRVNQTGGGASSSAAGGASNAKTGPVTSTSDATGGTARAVNNITNEPVVNSSANAVNRPVDNSITNVTSRSVDNSTTNVNVEAEASSRSSAEAEINSRITNNVETQSNHHGD